MGRRRLNLLRPVLLNRPTCSTYNLSRNRELESPRRLSEGVVVARVSLPSDDEVEGLESLVHPNWEGKAFGEFWQRQLAREFVRWSKIFDYRTYRVIYHCLGLLFGVRPDSMPPLKLDGLKCLKPTALDPELEFLYEPLSDEYDYTGAQRHVEETQFPVDHDLQVIVQNPLSTLYLSPYYGVVKAPLGVKDNKLVMYNAKNPWVRRLIEKSSSSSFPEIESEAQVFELSEGGTEIPFIFIDLKKRKQPPAWTSPVTLRMNFLLNKIKLQFEPKEGDLLFGRNLKAFGVYLPQGWLSLIGYRLERGLEQDYMTTRRGTPFGHLNGHILCYTGRKQRYLRLKRLVRHAFDPRTTIVVKLNAPDLVHADFKAEMFLHHLKLRYKDKVSFLRFRVPRPRGGVSWYFFLQKKGLNRYFTDAELKYLRDYLSRSWEYRTMKKKYGIAPFWARGRDLFYRARSLKHMHWLLSQLKRTPLIMTAVLNTLARFNKKILCVDDYTTSRDLDWILHRERRYPSKPATIKRLQSLKLLPSKRKEAERLYRLIKGKGSYEFEPTWFHRKFPYTGFGKALRVASGSEPPDMKENGVVLRFKRSDPLVAPLRFRDDDSHFIVFAYDPSQDVLKVLRKSGCTRSVPLGYNLHLLWRIRKRKKYAKIRNMPLLLSPSLEKMQYRFRIRRGRQEWTHYEVNGLLEGFREDGTPVYFRRSYCFLPVLGTPKDARALKVYVLPLREAPFILCSVEKW